MTTLKQNVCLLASWVVEKILTQQTSDLLSDSFVKKTFSVNYIRAKEGVWGAEFVLVTKHFIACV